MWYNWCPMLFGVACMLLVAEQEVGRLSTTLYNPRGPSQALSDVLQPLEPPTPKAAASTPFKQTMNGSQGTTRDTFDNTTCTAQTTTQTATRDHTPHE